MKKRFFEILCAITVSAMLMGCGKAVADSQKASENTESTEADYDEEPADNAPNSELESQDNDAEVKADENDDIETAKTGETPEEDSETESSENEVENTEENAEEEFIGQAQTDELTVQDNTVQEIADLSTEPVAPAPEPAPAPPTEQNPEVIVNTAPVVDNAIQQYYARSVFVGDSIMVGYSYYSLSHSEACAYYSNFLCCTSFSLRHALNPVSSDSLQPTYMGKKMNVWTAIEQMDVDRVFLMFGTNDLVCYNYDTIMEYYTSLIANIRSVKPDIEINIISMTPVVYGAPVKGMLTIEGINALNITIVQNMSVLGYKYVDLFQYLVGEDGYLPYSLSSDGFCHMTTAAYQGYWEAAFNDYANSQIY